ncbi:MAG: GNAT family N-acetyltransferase [Candidatus Devosia phytovorans]|uniref:GNAT family N-acetyltransferase n=1 Tax=Candidatus Devosia phytovorans TaxID=3121372 RepID=A0AAJ5VUW7_9HYPH|nr:GNAT family N-acetyltransferase [Devosia sp.]WEK05321.1 MAG: GNAT family N-acetyltransferase [Devosia sp.]
MSAMLRLRKPLAGPVPAPIWPAGIEPAPFHAVDPRKLHALLETAFPGRIAPCDDWYGNLTQDEEFDPALCVPALTEAGGLAGFIQCWTSDFVKDLAVAPAHRGKGLGTALLQHAFTLFAERGASHVDLKTSLDDDPAARRLYARLGMVEVAP